MRSPNSRTAKILQTANAGQIIMNRRIIKNNRLLAKPDIEITEWNTQENILKHP